MEVLMNQDAELLLANLPETMKAGVKEVELETGEVVLINPLGILRVSPGQNPNKPMVRDMTNGRLVRGSGRHPRANDAAAVSRRSSYKRSKSYREAIERAIPYENPEARYSLEKLIDAAFNAADGSPQYVQCEGCGKHQVKVLKQDGNLIFKLIELLVGSAPKTIELSGGVDLRIQEIMSGQKPFEVWDISQEEVDQRTKLLLEEGVIEAEWLEVEDGPVESDMRIEVD
jgi:hypothetical protein